MTCWCFSTCTHGKSTSLNNLNKFFNKLRNFQEKNREKANVLVMIKLLITIAFVSGAETSQIKY
jgi:hypothetical protein